ncbi:MAG: DUF5685 family protein [Oscillospiraceae bacterium]|nr:DUF5685 family protein [Oscillospiraceae bacterium]MDD3832793.1 DUF5685 family protein [Oscillospiraceae bacterium]MDD4546230.1 DUF5685 family protein [Oscillospiraceae bacterium]
MFGYVRVYKPDLRMAEYEHYQGIYCSLCKQLGKSYGFFSQMTLSYDFAFLALFHMALSDECAGFKKGRCKFNPLKKRTCCCENEHIKFSADAASILNYFKIKDNISDSGFFKSIPARLLLPFASRARKKAAKCQPRLDNVVSSCIDKQRKLESECTASIDAAAEPTALILSVLAQNGAKDETERRIRERFGYCLGRWIYLIDAADDIENDIRQGSYNPFVYSYGLKNNEAPHTDIESLIMPVLNTCLGECISAYNLLSVNRFDGILRNVLEQGIPNIQKQVFNKVGKFE